MGTVYEALDTALDRRVAVKVVREELVAASGAADRFFDEARLAARLVHPNVVTVHDFGMAGRRQPFLVMERLIGRTLRKEMDEHVGFPADRMLTIFAGVCQAVDAAHRVRLVHRDLKPENIFLIDTEAGPLPKVLDFGVARSLLTSSGAVTRSRTGPGVLVGTPEYMAPEQLRGEPAAPAWDLWSLAVIALEVLGGSTGLASIQPGTPWDPARHLRSTRPHCAEFLTRALSLDCALRPPDARTFYAQLEHAIRADTTAARPTLGGQHGRLFTMRS